MQKSLSEKSQWLNLLFYICLIRQEYCVQQNSPLCLYHYDYDMY